VCRHVFFLTRDRSKRINRASHCDETIGKKLPIVFSILEKKELNSEPLFIGDIIVVSDEAIQVEILFGHGGNGSYCCKIST